MPMSVAQKEDVTRGGLLSGWVSHVTEGLLRAGAG
jgi:hypothetical protein